MKNLIIAIILLCSSKAFASPIEINVETTTPASVCNNTKELTRLLSPFIEISLIECSYKLINNGWMGTKEYLVNIQIESNVKSCKSDENQAIVFDIPTNTYPHWSPPARFSYIDKVLNELEFESHVSVRNIGPNLIPKYKQIVLIPECTFKTKY